MCYGCYEEEGKPSIINKATRAAAKLIESVYDFSEVGGNAHVVVNDWNLDDDDIQWCLDAGLTENLHQANLDQLCAEYACLKALLA